MPLYISTGYMLSNLYESAVETAASVALVALCVHCAQGTHMCVVSLKTSEKLFDA